MKISFNWLRDEHGEIPFERSSPSFVEDGVSVTGKLTASSTVGTRARYLFHEYFHGDSGAGLGASHQTGWTGLVAKLIQQQGEFGTVSAQTSNVWGLDSNVAQAFV